MKTLLIFLALLCALSAQETRKEIGDVLPKKTEIIEVVQASRIWRIQADANGSITVFFETVAKFPDGTEVKIASTSTSRRVDAAESPLRAIEKLARTWLDEDEAAKAAKP